METRSSDVAPTAAVEKVPRQDWFSRLPALAETAARTAGALGLFAYAIGLVTVNAYLLSLGVSDFSLLRPRFVYAGILVLLSLGITWAFLMLALYTVGESLKNLWTHRPALWWGRFVGVLGWGLVLGGFTPLAIFVIAMRVGPSWRDAGPALALWVAGSVLGLVMTGAAEGIIGSKARLRELPVTMVFLAGYVFIFLLLFARLIYPAVPEQFGGGRSKPGRLMADPTTVSGLAEIGVSFPGHGSISACIEILFDTAEAYVVRSAKGDVVLVGKSVVKAVLIDPPSVRCAPEK